MPLNISKGNMYPFITHTWNTVKGKCPHDCSYCYMKRFKQNELRFDMKELETDLGKDNFIFVGSSCDMFANETAYGWINETIIRCGMYNNKYLFQSKNPFRMFKWTYHVPLDSVFSTTIETNRHYPQMGNAPPVINRAEYMGYISQNLKTMVTVEPIMDFDVDYLHHLIHLCNPEWVNIGADSKGHDLPEPSAKKIKELIEVLREDGIEVKLKNNLKRLGV